MQKLSALAGSPFPTHVIALFRVGMEKIPLYCDSSLYRDESDVDCFCDAHFVGFILRGFYKKHFVEFYLRGIQRESYFMFDDFLRLKGKNVLVFGIANRKSVAFHIAKELVDAGAHLICSVLLKEHEEVVNKHFPEARVYFCDLSSEERIAELADAVRGDYGAIHGIVHSVAFANFADGIKPFHETPKDDFLRAFDISCFSLTSIAGHFKDIIERDGAIVTISISTTRMASENYGYMAPIKAALDSSVCFLAKSLGARNGVRVNAVGASLLKTSASAGIPGYIEPLLFAEKATIRKKSLQTSEVADVAAFLLSPRSSGITAQTVIVDAGMSSNYFDKEIVSKTVKP